MQLRKFAEERDWDQQKVMQNIGWLKHMNARGYDVWIRPSGEHSIIVLGGLNAAQLQTLKDKEYMPAAAPRQNFAASWMG